MRVIIKKTINVVAKRKVVSNVSGRLHPTKLFAVEATIVCSGLRFELDTRHSHPNSFFPNIAQPIIGRFPGIKSAVFALRDMAFNRFRFRLNRARPGGRRFYADELNELSSVLVHLGKELVWFPL